MFLKKFLYTKTRMAAAVVAGYFAILAALYGIDAAAAPMYQAMTASAQAQVAQAPAPSQLDAVQQEAPAAAPMVLEAAKEPAPEPEAEPEPDLTSAATAEQPAAEATPPAAQTPAPPAVTEPQEAQQPAAEQAPAEPAEQAPAEFVPSSGGGYSSQVRSWANKNSDIKGWIRVPGTNINYPVAHHPDIDYYLERGYSKEYSRNGVIWTNGGTSFGSSSDISNNTVLYGHNWTNVSSNPRVNSGGDVMFAQLTGYHHLSTAQRNPYIYYSTADEDMTFKIFAVFYTELAFNYIEPSGGQDIIDEALRRSRFNFDVDVSSSDKILTLSTCTRAYGKTSNQRFVVMARLLRSGEGTGAYSITSNPNHKQPNVWS